MIAGATTWSEIEENLTNTINACFNRNGKEALVVIFRPWPNVPSGRSRIGSRPTRQNQEARNTAFDVDFYTSGYSIWIPTL
jgi:hypothetical protein